MIWVSMIIGLLELLLTWINRQASINEEDRAKVNHLLHKMDLVTKAAESRGCAARYDVSQEM